MTRQAWLAVAALEILAPVAAAGEAPKLAVLGDSLSTGAATHPELAFDGKRLWKVFNGETPTGARVEDLPEDLRPLVGSLAPPARLWPTVREYFGGPDWTYRNVLQSLSRAYLDTEEYSWGYLYAAEAGLSPATMLIAAENGARAEAMPRQIDRLLEATGGVLPESIFVLYTGNDLCGAALPQVTSVDDYERALARGFDYLLRNGRAPSQGARVYLLSYLSVLQLLHSEDILAKKIYAFGEETTCRALREQGYLPKARDFDPGLPPEAWYFSLFMPPNPAAFCPTLFGGFGQDKDETIGALANRIRQYRERQEKVVERYNAIAAAKRDAPPIKFHFVAATAELNFDAADIAGDCFHLSVAGQAKIARAVFTEWKRLQN